MDAEATVSPTLPDLEKLISHALIEVSDSSRWQGSLRKATAIHSHRSAESLWDPRLVSRVTGDQSARRTYLALLQDSLRAHPFDPDALVAPGPGGRPEGPPKAADVVVSGMQKWEGRVVRVDGDYFTAEITPLTESGPSVYADFLTEMLNLVEPETVEAGDVVYVTVRTVNHGKGFGVSRTSSVRLRRLGVWTAEEIEQIKGRAKRRYEEIADYIE